MLTVILIEVSFLKNTGFRKKNHSRPHIKGVHIPGKLILSYALAGLVWSKLFSGTEQIISFFFCRNPFTAQACDPGMDRDINTGRFFFVFGTSWENVYLETMSLVADLVKNIL